MSTNRTFTSVKPNDAGNCLCFRIGAMTKNREQYEISPVKIANNGTFKRSHIVCTERSARKRGEAIRPRGKPLCNLKMNVSRLRRKSGEEMALHIACSSSLVCIDCGVEYLFSFLSFDENGIKIDFNATNSSTAIRLAVAVCR